MSGGSEERIRIERAGGPCRAKLGDQLLAQSADALLLYESGYEPVVYFPLRDTERARLSASATRSHCPYKGDARYFVASVDGELVDVAWYYPTPLDDVAAIAEHVAFYPDRVAITRA